jgi:periplasmic divalent cation tolerance protein
MTPLLVFVTASSVEEARRIASHLLDQKLAACVNVLPGVESHYWWEGKKESAAECLLVVKTAKEAFEAVSRSVRELHSYTCPEIVGVLPAEVEAAYGAWWRSHVPRGN